MSTISVSNIQTANGTENLTVTTGNTTGSRMIVRTTGGMTLTSNSTANAIDISATGTVTLSSNLVLGTTTITANGSVGTAKQALVSGATGNVSWTTLDLTYLPDAAFKKSVKASTTADLSAASSTTTTLTGGLVALPAQDGITLVVGDRLLVKDQSTQSQNGIYDVTNVGAAGTTAWVLTRSADADTASELAGAFVNVDDGTLNGGKTYDTDFKTSSTIGTTAVTFNRNIDDGGGTFIGNVTMSGTLQTISGNANFDAGVLFVDATNNRVGVGTTAPDANLTVTGTANVSGATRIAGITTLAANAVLSGTLQTVAGNTNFDSGVLFVDATNNRVGVGTTAPDANLTVTGTANVSGVSRFAANVTVVGNLNISSTLANTGWVMLNSGLKMNWGVIAANSSTLGNATFSSAFASGPYSVSLSGANSLGNNAWSAGVNSTVVQVRSSNTSATGGLVYYIAIGI